MRTALGAALAAAVLTAAACAPTESDSPTSSAPQHVDRPAPTASAPGVTLPFTWKHSPVAATSWDRIPLERAGIFLGASVSRDNDTVTFTAVDSSGTIRWRAERPASRTGYALSRADGKPVAVLTDTEAGSSSGVTASGYDLATGRTIWGPVNVPGPLEGPGLVFAAPARGSATGSAEMRRALNPATGQTVAEQRPGTDIRVIGEYDGLVLIVDGDQLRALEASSGTVHWRRNAPAGAWRAASTEPAPTGAALLRERDGAHSTLVDLADGSIIDRHVRQAGWADGTAAWITLGDRTMRAYRDGTLQWERQLYAPTQLAALDPVLVYLRVGERVQVVNTLTGNDAVAYPQDASRGGYAVPALISASTSAAIIRADGRTLLLATVSAD